MAISQRIEELGLHLPEPARPVAAYVPAVVHGGLCFTSGQLPFDQGRLLAEGMVGREVSLETAYAAARQAALNAVSAAALAVGGLDRLTGVVKVVGLVQSAPDFHQQPQVLNGASELLQAVFGEAGRHARTAVGVSALPLNAAVEVECIFSWDAHGH
ncbi:MAG: RidA family protein [Thermaerobacter sp.]|nr:RidA family protein [Thermaerobacter sp.]